MQAFTLGQPPPLLAETKSPPVASSLQRNSPDITKTPGVFVDMVSKAWASSAEPPFIRRRKEATTAEADYRKGVRSLDCHRLKLEERIEETLESSQGWESERLHAVKNGARALVNVISSFP